MARPVDNPARSRLIVQTYTVNDVEDLRQPVKGADVRVNQLEGGQLTGSLTYGVLGNFSLSLGHFSKAIRSEGVMSRDRQVIGMLLGQEDAVSVWSFDMRPGDIVFDHLGGTHDGIYKGGIRFATIALDPVDLTRLMGGEAAMADFAFWQRRTLIRPNPRLGVAIANRFTEIVHKLEESAAGLSPVGSEFWTRALVETFVGTATGGVLQDGDSGPIKSTLIVRKVDDFLEEHTAAPIHISQLCQALQVSRRSLHRAFNETLGIGPVTYLRRQRLNGVRRALLSGDAQLHSIGEVALNHGFDHLGRFSEYYRYLFNELPSDTLRRRSQR